MKIIKLLILISFSLNLNCINVVSTTNKKTTSTIDKNIVWYEKVIIRDITRENEKRYGIQLGISAIPFYLDSNLENVFKILNYSFKNKKNIKVGIESNSTKIVCANKLTK